MKLSYHQLASQLKKELSPIYIVSGEEMLLKQEAIDLIRQSARQENFEESIRVTPDTNFDENQIYTLLYANSLLAKKRFLELDLQTITLTKSVDKILQAYAERPIAENIILININKIDDKINKAAWYRSFEKKGIVVSIWPIARDQLPQWIIQRAKKYNLHLPLDIAELIANRVEGNLIAAAQIIEKIQLLQPHILNYEIIDNIITNENRFSIFDFIESLIARDSKRALHILNNLKTEGIEPAIILWGITRELRLLAELAEQIERGYNEETLFQQYRIFFQRKIAIRKFLAVYKAKQCWQLLMHAAEIDKIIKGAVRVEVWNCLQIFCLRLL